MQTLMGRTLKIQRVLLNVYSCVKHNLFIVILLHTSFLLQMILHMRQLRPNNYNQKYGNKAIVRLKNFNYC